MTEKEVHEFAKQADLCWTNGQPMIEIHLLERFAKLVAAEKDKQITFLKDSHDAIRELAYKTGAAEEREECAKLCDEFGFVWPSVAVAIRSRGEK